MKIYQSKSIKQHDNLLQISILNQRCLAISNRCFLQETIFSIFDEWKKNTFNFKTNFNFQLRNKRIMISYQNRLQIKEERKNASLLFMCICVLEEFIIFLNQMKGSILQKKKTGLILSHYKPRIVKANDQQKEPMQNAILISSIMGQQSIKNSTLKESICNYVDPLANKDIMSRSQSVCQSRQSQLFNCNRSISEYKNKQAKKLTPLIKFRKDKSSNYFKSNGLYMFLQVGSQQEKKLKQSIDKLAMVFKKYFKIQTIKGQSFQTYLQMILCILMGIKQKKPSSDIIMEQLKQHTNKLRNEMMKVKSKLDLQSNTLNFMYTANLYEQQKIKLKIGIQFLLLIKQQLHHQINCQRFQIKLYDKQLLGYSGVNSQIINALPQRDLSSVEQQNSETSILQSIQQNGRQTSFRSSDQECLFKMQQLSDGLQKITLLQVEKLPDIYQPTPFDQNTKHRYCSDFKAQSARTSCK